MVLFYPLVKRFISIKQFFLGTTIMSEYLWAGVQLPANYQRWHGYFILAIFSGR
jgi:4-hydroxybenzoate polyprenyltransferase